ncbi:hypothetical protein [Maribacter halichondriae]|uniref:hypothetical protein n=1 Tax=Maribacter halichondriae TaxID=2980554 RepID=UPI002359CC04|nr:hypothetical protein [Maribacter sp. Hal144]
MKNTKKIRYRGILTFEIPKNWIEEYDDEHGGSFYEDTPLSGTLRLKIMSLNAPSGENQLEVLDVLSGLNVKESKTISLPNKNAYKMFYEQTTDSGHEITIYYWSLAQLIKPKKARLANFSYTILTSRLNLESVNKEIEFITEQVENAHFESENK